MKRLQRWVYSKIPFKKAMYSALKTVWSPPQFIYRHLHFSGVFSVSVPGRSFRINHHGYEVENEIFWRGTRGWEPVSMRLWMQLCRASRVILDIGANTGIYSLVAQAINADAKVFAFEPVGRIFGRLVANRDLNGYEIHCVRAAAANFDGTATIYETLTEHLYSVTVNRNLNSPDTPTVAVQVQAQRLDTFLNSLPAVPGIDLMKLDVETYEPEVLEGLGSFLARCRPAMLVEILSEEAARRIERLLGGLGYLYFNIDEVGAPRWQTHLTKSDHFNFLVCREEQARLLGLSFGMEDILP